jgi:hypothetical protein
MRSLKRVAGSTLFSGVGSWRALGSSTSAGFSEEQVGQTVRWPDPSGLGRASVGPPQVGQGRLLSVAAGGSIIIHRSQFDCSIRSERQQDQKVLWGFEILFRLDPSEFLWGAHPKFTRRSYLAEGTTGRRQAGACNLWRFLSAFHAHRRGPTQARIPISLALKRVRPQRLRVRVSVKIPEDQQDVKYLRAMVVSDDFGL